jgi:predicted aspartyl protease
VRSGILVVLSIACSAPRAAAEHEDRDRALLTAAETCARQLSGALVTGIRNGVVQLELMDHGDGAAFDRCYQEAAPRALQALAAGRLAEHAAHASATIETTGSMIFVPALLNGLKARLLLDTGATKTIIRPKLAQLAGIEPGREAPLARMIVAGGGQLSVPLVRAQSLAINEAAVQAIEIGVYEAVPDLPDVDGILGTDYLSHFTVTIDRQKGTLLLVPLRSSDRTN